MKLYHLAGAMALALGVATAASAQGSAPPEGPPRTGMHRGPGGPGRMDELLLKGITLTDAQRDSLKKLNAAQEAQMRAMFEASKGQPRDSAARAKMRALREQQRAQFRAVLTDEQKPIYDKNVAEIQANMRQHMRERNNDRRDAPPPPPPQQ